MMGDRAVVLVAFKKFLVKVTKDVELKPGKPSASFRLSVTPGLELGAELWVQLRTASTVISCVMT